ncbi:class I SAM-dependent methyltransferase [Nonomuraea longicatena]|uniref:class I SAM-dependent methyltransferase n=1 Tax=Nonomuraea longicatena TaxID=83682 RepID=UPI0031D48B46
MTQDQYTLATPFYDLWHLDGHIPEVRALLPGMLADVEGPVLEIGAGTGLVTETIAAATDGEVFAVEPALGMRAILLSRLAERPDLRARVTVLPWDVLDTDLDEPVSAVVMISVLYGLPPADRARVWPVLARQLRPGGHLIFNWRPRPVAEPGEPEPMGSYRVGRHTYEVWGQVLAATPMKTTSRLFYRIVHRGVVISEDVVDSESYRPEFAELAAELGAAGFTAREAPQGMTRWRLGT